jgi:hypothetical protein
MAMSGQLYAHAPSKLLQASEFILQVHAQDTDYPEVSTWLSSVHPEQYRGNTLNLVKTDSFGILSNSIFTTVQSFHVT